MSDTLIMNKEDWPYGLRCLNCNEKIPEGNIYSKNLVGISDDTFIMEIVCGLCAMGISKEEVKVDNKKWPDDFKNFGIVIR
jgi:hypothetical protein